MLKEYDIELFIDEDKCLDFESWGSVVFITINNSKGYYSFDVVGNKIEYEDDTLIEWSNRYQLLTYIRDDNENRIRLSLLKDVNIRL